MVSPFLEVPLKQKHPHWETSEGVLFVFTKDLILLFIT